MIEWGPARSGRAPRLAKAATHWEAGGEYADLTR